MLGSSALPVGCPSTNHRSLLQEAVLTYSAIVSSHNFFVVQEVITDSSKLREQCVLVSEMDNRLPLQEYYLVLVSSLEADTTIADANKPWGHYSYIVCILNSIQGIDLVPSCAVTILPGRYSWRQSFAHSQIQKSCNRALSINPELLLTVFALHLSSTEKPWEAKLSSYIAVYDFVLQKTGLPHVYCMNDRIPVIQCISHLSSGLHLGIW